MDQKDEMNNKIVAMWNANMTSSEIAKALHITRSAVMGRVSRLREKGVALRSIQKIKPAIKREVKTRRGWVMKKQPKPKSAPVISLDQFTLDIPEPPTDISIMELKENSCRYVIGSDRRRGALYCGKPKARRSYCEEHAKLCYVIVPLERSDKRSSLLPSQPQRS